jgi:hypothetical protein
LETPEVNSPELKLTEAELREIKENLEFFLEMDVADEVAVDPAWDKPLGPEGDNDEFPKLP